MTERLRSPGFALVVVGFGIFVAADDLTVATTLLRQIVGDLRIPLPEGFDDAAWIVNAYLVAYVAVMPIAGRLSDLVGRRRVFVGGLVVFGIGSAVIPFTTSLGPFLAGRVATAIGGGAMVPVAFAVVGDLYAEQRRGRALGALGAIETLGWVWGPLFGALLVRYLDWRWQFYLNVPLAATGIVFAWVALKGVGDPVPGRRIDAVGAASLSVALTALAIGLLQIGEISSAVDLAGLGEGGGWPAWPFFIAAAVATGVLIAAERRGSDPLIDPAMLHPPNVMAALGANLLVGAALAVAMVDIPLFVNLVVETELQRAAVLSGWVLTALTAAMAASTALGGRLTDRFSYRPPAVAGAAIATVALVAMGATWDTTTGLATLAVSAAILGVGLGIATAPLTTAVVDAIPVERRGVGTALVVIARLIGLTLGLAGLTAWALLRYDTLRAGLVLPPLTDPSYADAADAAQRSLSASVLGETFVAAAVVALAAVSVSAALERRPPVDPERWAQDPVDG